MKIRIKVAPDGSAPDWVRQAWIGVELETESCHNPNDSTHKLRSVDGSDPSQKNIGGYKVNPQKAVEALKQINPDAAEWWYTNTVLEALDSFVFGKDFCEVIEE